MLDLLVAAVIGEAVPRVLELDPGHARTHVVTVCAEASTTATAYGCLSCGQFLANEHQLYEHLDSERASRHVIARRCIAHGWEAP